MYKINFQIVSRLFNHCRIAHENLNKITYANSYAHCSKGTRKMRKARKYQRPEDLEDPFYYGIGPKPKVEHVYESIKARGFGKELPSYKPVSDLEDQLHSLCKKVFGSQLSKEWKSQSLDDRVLKYKLLTKATELLKKEIPNSELHKMKSMNDVHEYFSTPVDGLYHYDSLVQNSNKLPPNLQVLPEAPRFNSSTDTFFDGVTAFPGRKRVLYTKEGEKFEKTIEWPHI